MLIGGVVGQNAANGKITDISILDEDLSVKITNSCEGTLGSYSVGGIVGQSSGYIIAANLSNVTIDGSKSIGVTSYMGGMAGQLTLSNNDGSMENCIVSGKVIAGISKKYGSLNSRSYTGGIAGAVYNMPVKGCRSMLDVAGPTEEMKRDDVLYATGGGFGRIRSANNYNFSKLIIWGSNLTGLASFIGNFAGIAPDSENWTDWMKNFGTYEINVRQFGTYKNIGENIADQDSQTGND